MRPLTSPQPIFMVINNSVICDKICAISEISCWLTWCFPSLFVLFCFSGCLRVEIKMSTLQCAMNPSCVYVSAFTPLDMCDVQLFAAENISSNDSWSPQTCGPPMGYFRFCNQAPLMRVSVPLFLHPNIDPNECFGNQGVCVSEAKARRTFGLPTSTGLVLSRETHGSPARWETWFF